MASSSRPSAGWVDAFPLCVKTQERGPVVETVYNISGSSAASTWRNIAAPRCFEIRAQLRSVGHPHPSRRPARLPAVITLAGLHQRPEGGGKAKEDSGWSPQAREPPPCHREKLCSPPASARHLLPPEGRHSTPAREGLNWIQGEMAGHQPGEARRPLLADNAGGADVFHRRSPRALSPRRWSGPYEPGAVIFACA